MYCKKSIIPSVRKRFLAVLCGILSLGLFWACVTPTAGLGDRIILRLHIRANSDAAADLAVKYAVRDRVMELLEPRLTGAASNEDAKKIAAAALEDIRAVSLRTLGEAGLTYGARASLENEVFPTRSYEGIVIPSGYYDALIIELGSGAGANWWCVIYPPLCFVGRQPGESWVTYRSRIRELWNSWFGR